jgi:hypothetical protein
MIGAASQSNRRVSKAGSWHNFVLAPYSALKKFRVSFASSDAAINVGSTAMAGHTETMDVQCLSPPLVNTIQQLHSH